MPVDMPRMHVPGMALVVLRSGKVIEQGAYGIASLERWCAGAAAALGGLREALE